jgi:hypothetical protein
MNGDRCVSHVAASFIDLDACVSRLDACMSHLDACVSQLDALGIDVAPSRSDVTPAASQLLATARQGAGSRVRMAHAMSQPSRSERGLAPTASSLALPPTSLAHCGMKAACPSVTVHLRSVNSGAF